MKNGATLTSWTGRSSSAPSSRPMRNTPPFTSTIPSGTVTAPNCVVVDCAVCSPDVPTADAGAVPSPILTFKGFVSSIPAPRIIHQLASRTSIITTTVTIPNACQAALVRTFTLFNPAVADGLGFDPGTSVVIPLTLIFRAGTVACCGVRSSAGAVDSVIRDLTRGVTS